MFVLRVRLPEFYYLHWQILFSDHHDIIRCDDCDESGSHVKLYEWYDAFVHSDSFTCTHGEIGYSRSASYLCDVNTQCFGTGHRFDYQVCGLEDTELDRDACRVVGRVLNTELGLPCPHFLYCSLFKFLSIGLLFPCSAETCFFSATTFLSR